MTTVRERFGEGIKYVKRTEERHILDENDELHLERELEIILENVNGDIVRVKTTDGGDSFTIKVNPLVATKSVGWRGEMAEKLAAAVMQVLNPQELPKLPDLKNVLDTPIDERHLTVRTYNCIGPSGLRIQYIGELVQRTEEGLLKTRNFGRKSLKEVRNILQSLGLSLGMNVGDWVPPNKRAKLEET